MFIGFAFVTIFGVSSNASAVSNPCWYDSSKTCSVSGVGACGTNDVLPGRTTGCAGKAIPDNAPNGTRLNNKTEFINFIERKINEGGRAEKGARFLISSTMSKRTDSAATKEANKNFNIWKAFMERDEVDVYRGNRILNNTSWYDPVKEDFFFAPYLTVRDTIIISFDRVEVIKIEALCGNLAEKDGDMDASATLDTDTGPDRTVNVGEATTFRQIVDASDRGGVGNDTFDFSITSSTGYPGYSAKSDTRQIAGDNNRVDNTDDVTFSQRGTYKRKINIGGYPTINSKYVKTEDTSSEQTITVKGWTMQTGSSSGKLNVGTTGTITHTVDNVDTAATDDGAPTHKSVAVTFSGGSPGSSDTSIASGYTAGEAAKSYTRTYTPDVRGKYCSTVYATPAADNNAAATSTEGCLTVDGWDINADSKVDGATSTDGRSKVIYVGSSATFRHRLYSSGDPLHKGVDGDVLISAGSKALPGCSAGGDWPSECWNYRYTSVDLSSSDSDQTAVRTYTFTQPGTYCENLRFNPSADNDPTPNAFDYNNYSTGTSACVYVIDPKPVVTTLVDYEKNSSTTAEAINFQIENSSYCPPAGSGVVDVTLRYRININGEFGGETTKQYGNGSCDNLSISVTDVPADKRDTLNGSEPGKLFPYTVNYTQAITTVSANGNIRVIEVPFAKFYGNDIYATTGEIRFNDTDNADSGTYDGRGSVNQYAALAFGNVKIDTSAFRTLPIDVPRAPNGLDAAGSGVALARASAGATYNNIVNNYLPACTAVGASIDLSTLNDNCYDARANDVTRITGSAGDKKITIVAKDVIIGSESVSINDLSVPVAPPTPPVSVPSLATVYKHTYFNAAPQNGPDAYAVGLSEGTYTKSQLQALGVLPNDISSIKVTSGYRVKLYDGDNFTGASKELTDNVADFTASTIQWNDVTESVIVEKVVAIGATPGVIRGTGDRWTNFATGGATTSVLNETSSLPTRRPPTMSPPTVGDPPTPSPPTPAPPTPSPPTPVPLADEALKNANILLIVAENIYIRDTVSRLDGILVASGTIHTCAKDSSPYRYDNKDLDENCRKALTINGALSAPTIKFERVGGSRYLNTLPEDDETNCKMSRGVLNCSRSVEMLMNTPKTTEVVNFPAYLYYTQPFLKDNSVPGGTVETMYVAPPRQ